LECEEYERRAKIRLFKDEHGRQRHGGERFARFAI